MPFDFAALILPLILIFGGEPGTGSKCLTPYGEVTWWAVVRDPQSSVYLTIDSENDDVKQLLYPWTEESPLRQTIEGASIGHPETDYLVYIGDWMLPYLEGNDISRTLQIGLLVQEFGYFTSSGFWLVHNNVLFPPRSGDSILNPPDPGWSAAFTEISEDTTAPYYFCTSIDTTSHLHDIVDHWLLTNPTLSVHDLKDSFWDEKLIRSSVPSAGFTFKTSMDSAHECFQSDFPNLVQQCLHEYRDPDTRLSILVRMRSLSYNWMLPCLQLLNHPSEGVAAPTWQLQYDPGHNINYPSDHVVHGVFAVTSTLVCFGNNVAANQKNTALMMCVQHPLLASWLIASGQSLDMSCHSALVNRYIPGKGFNPVQPDHSAKHSSQCNKCNAYSRSVTGRMYQHGQNENFLPRWHEDYDEVFHKKEVLYLDREVELSEYLMENENAIVGIFCRKGCRYCDSMGRKLDSLAAAVLDLHSDVDIVVVDVNTLGFPEELSVVYTPTVRYRPPLRRGERVIWYDITTGIPDPMLVNDFIFNLHKEILEDKVSMEAETAQTPEDNGNGAGRSMMTNKEGVTRRRVKRSPGDPGDDERNGKNDDPIKQSPDQRASPDYVAVDESRVINTEANSYSCEDNPGMIRCLSSVDNDGVSLLDIPDEYLPVKRKNCQGDRRLLFSTSKDIGCTPLQFNIICRQSPSDEGAEIYRAVCSDGPSRRRKGTWRHAEGNLLLKVKADKAHIEAMGRIHDNKRKCRISFVISNSPCFERCSGAYNGPPYRQYNVKDEYQTGDRNIPKIIDIVKGASNAEFDVKISFSKAYPDPEGATEVFRHLQTQGYRQSFCVYDRYWWARLRNDADTKEGADKVQEAEKDRVTYEEQFQEYLTNHTELDITNKANCVLPRGSQYLITPDWVNPGSN